MSAIKPIKKLLPSEFYTKEVGRINKSLIPDSLDSNIKNLILRAERIYMALIVLSVNTDSDSLKGLIPIARDFYFAIINHCTGKTGLSIDDLNAVFLKISAMLDEGVLGGCISVKNTEIIKKAMINFVKLFETLQVETVSGMPAFKEEDFVAVLSDKPIVQTETAFANEDTQSHGEQLADNINDNKRHKTTINDNKRHKTTINDNKRHETTNKPINTGGEISKRAKSLLEQSATRNRRMQIINALESAEAPMTGAEISNALPEWSIKTIQREINAMVEEGLLAKSGSKRWTRYALNIT